MEASQSALQQPKTHKRQKSTNLYGRKTAPLSPHPLRVTPMTAPKSIKERVLDNLQPTTVLDHGHINIFCSPTLPTRSLPKRLIRKEERWLCHRTANLCGEDGASAADWTKRFPKAKLASVPEASYFFRFSLFTF